MPTYIVDHPTKLHVLKEDQRLLDVELTPEELQTHGAALAAVTSEIATESERQQAVKEQLKARLTELAARQSGLAATINRKKEIREVEVVTFADYEKGHALTVRTDSGEILSTRELTAAERQRPLPGLAAEGGPPA